MSDLAVIGILLLLSNVFWAVTCHRLINKVMSRDFTEFRTAELKKELPQKRDVKPVHLVDDMAPMESFGL